MIYDRLGCDPTTGTSELYVRDALLIQWRYISYNNIKLQNDKQKENENIKMIDKILIEKNLSSTSLHFSTKKLKKIEAKK